MSTDCIDVTTVQHLDSQLEATDHDQYAQSGSARTMLSIHTSTDVTSARIYVLPGEALCLMGTYGVSGERLSSVGKVIWSGFKPYESPRAGNNPRCRLPPGGTRQVRPLADGSDANQFNALAA